MALRFVYGDSYGGVQGAEQGYDQMRDARYFNSLAVQDRRRQQAAQEAMERARLEEAAESRALSLFLNQTEMANRNRQFDVGSGQWEREFGLRSTQVDESRADREAQKTYQYDALRSGERMDEARLESDKLRYGAMNNVRRNDLFKSALAAAPQVDYPSVAAVMSHYEGELSPAEAQVIFDVSRSARQGPREDLQIAQALAEMTKRKAGVQAQQNNPEKWFLTPFMPRGGSRLNPITSLQRLLPGESTYAQLRRQGRDLQSEEGDIDKEIERLNLRLEFPQPVASPVSAPPPIPRTIIPVNGGPVTAAAPIPINGVARPATVEEFNLLPRGTRFINPANGELRIKN